MKIYLNDINGNSIEVESDDIKKYFGTDYPRKECTLIIFKDDSEIRVSDDFDTVDNLVNKYEKKDN